MNPETYPNCPCCSVCRIVESELYGGVDTSGYHPDSNPDGYLPDENGEPSHIKFSVDIGIRNHFEFTTEITTRPAIYDGSVRQEDVPTDVQDPTPPKSSVPNGTTIVFPDERVSGSSLTSLWRKIELIEEVVLLSGNTKWITIILNQAVAKKIGDSDTIYFWRPSPAIPTTKMFWTESKWEIPVNDYGQPTDGNGVWLPDALEFKITDYDPRSIE